MQQHSSHCKQLEFPTFEALVPCWAWFRAKIRLVLGLRSLFSVLGARGDCSQSDPLGGGRKVLGTSALLVVTSATKVVTGALLL